MTSKEAREKMRRSAAYLQGGNTAYFSKPDLIEAIRTLYRLADEITQ